MYRLFLVIAKNLYADECEKNLFVSLIAGEKFRKWLVKNSDHFPTSSPRDEKRRRFNVLSVSHGSVTTARLEEKALTMRPHRPHRSKGLTDKRSKE
ncbi:hypothetical protein TNCV_1552011 [Trichonephila clavipes]|nr:hypothetical protein TNCV_1552011 [Trichonephila clavipes]